MSNTPLISVIVSVYNVEKYIKRCLESIIKQTYSNIEIILVDDGSTDRSGIICDEYASRDTRVKVIHKVNGGLVSARKAGLERATGEYVSNLDSDDWIENGAYDYVVNVLNRFHVDMVCCSFYKEYEGIIEDRQEYLDEGVYTRDSILGEFKHVVEDKPFFCPLIHGSLWTKTIKRELLNTVQFSVDDHIVMGEDDAVTLPLLLKIQSLYISKKSFYHYCVNTTSVSWKKRRDDLGRLNKLSNGLKSNFVSLSEENTHEYIYRYYLYTMAFIWLDMMDLADSDYLEEKNELPFWPDVKRDSNIVVYGKGLWASNLINVIQKASFCNIVANMDSSDLDDYKDFLRNDEYDRVVIAIADGRIRSKVKNALLELGAADSKISLFDKQSISEDIIPFIH